MAFICNKLIPCIECEDYHYGQEDQRMECFAFTERQEEIAPIREKEFKYIPSESGSTVKNCPCCGGKAELLYTKQNPNGVLYNNFVKSEKGFVQCRKCGIRTKEYSRMSRAVEIWNRRV